MGYTTKKSLLEAIREGDEVSWFEFYETYRPLIILRGNDYRLSSVELEDLCQLVLLDLFKAGRRFRYDPAKGRFRDYLRRVITLRYFLEGNGFGFMEKPNHDLRSSGKSIDRNKSAC